MSPTTVITGHNIISCLGNSTAANWESLLEGCTGLKQEDVSGGYRCPVGRVSKGEEPSFDSLVRMTVDNSPAGWEWSSADTGWILCSAKGNVASLSSKSGTYHLAENAQQIAHELGMQHAPSCISTACTSSLAGIVLAIRMMKAKQYKRVAITGCDLASDFVLNGFNRIKATSSEICRPYDAERNGINLATAAATVFLEWKTPAVGEIHIAGEATSNDGFHISRPTPDGAGLSNCIQRSCGGQIPDFICGHGTATILNDNMESEAVYRSSMHHVPLFSVKGQTGHTLGACGVLETIITAKCLEENTILASYGFKNPGTSANINISRQVQKRSLSKALNISVGFGGGNGALLLAKA